RRQAARLPSGCRWAAGIHGALQRGRGERLRRLRAALRGRRPMAPPHGDAKTDLVLWDVSERIATITLNRPERNNAFTMEMEHQYFDLLEHAADDPELRVIIVTGAGRSFCPGLD